jgi:hypothetical protein
VPLKEKSASSFEANMTLSSAAIDRKNCLISFYMEISSAIGKQQ